MKATNKILIWTLIIFSTLFFSLTFAAEDTTDCALFATPLFHTNKSFEIVQNTRELDKNQYSNFLTLDQRNSIIDAKSLNTAILNLKKYCCVHNMGVKSSYETCKTDKVYFNDNTLDSPYLFDHLFDIIIRRLTGLTWNNDIYQSMTVDPKWQERRERINSKAENLSWSNPQEIINKYQEFRTLTPKYNLSKVEKIFWGQDSSAFLNYVSWNGNSDESKETATTLQEYNQWTLYDRYNNACALTEYFYRLLNQWISSSDNNHIVQIVSQWKCSQFITQRIMDENQYTANIINESSNLFLSNTTREYISYLYDRLQKLESQRHDTVDKRTYVVRAVPQLVKHCTK